MEDIAKIYNHLKDVESSIAWLRQAAACAWTLWGSWVATQHIVDKLVAALNVCGKQGEADLCISPLICFIAVKFIAASEGAVDSEDGD
ncbi:hypothetical protein MMC12_008033 [Toensbergia leucococca]|nr:hypothetical protein [Toensbergia leucococca]